MRKFLAAAGLAVTLAGPAMAQTSVADDPPETVAAGVHVDGFRSAKWGMTEAEVKAAILNDFEISADGLTGEVNPTEKTTVLAIVVTDLIPGAGTARVSYILGYTTQKLIEVNIVWGASVDPQAKPDMVTAAANQLRNLFLTSGYDPGTIATDTRGGDGWLVIFAGQDADKHSTVLRLLQGRMASQNQQQPAAVLFLSYVMDSRNPDVFKPKSGP